MAFPIRTCRALACAALLSFPLPCLADSPRGAKYAVLVGVTEYAQGFRNLRYTENDVEELAKVLKGPRAGFAEVKVLATGRGKNNPAEAPTRENIDAAIDALTGKARKGDLILVALSGHGVLLGGTSYFCPADARLDDPQGTMIGLSRLFEKLGTTKAAAGLVLVDACRNDPNEGRNIRSDRFEDQESRIPPKVAVVFSCTEGQLAREHESLGHGIFFHSVLEALRSEDDTGQAITWDDLVEHVSRGVEEKVEEIYKGAARQTTHRLANLTSTSPVLVEAGKPSNSVFFKALDHFKIPKESFAQLQLLGQIATGVLGLLSAILSLVVALIGRGASRAFAAPSDSRPPGPPLRISLKGLLKGWISTALWSVFLGILFGLGLAGYAGYTVSTQQPPQPGPAAGEPPDRAPPEGGPGDPLYEAQRQQLRAEYERLLGDEKVQIVMLIVFGLAYVRGAYVAARTAKTTTLMRLAHGLAAIASFEIAGVLFLQHYFPQLLAASKPPLVEEWEIVATVAAGILGAILGSED